MAVSGLARILAIVGGVVIIVEGVLGILGLLDISLGFHYPGEGGFGILSGLISIIIGIVIGVIVLIATGTIKSRGNVSFNGITILILGIIGLVFAYGIGSVLVIIAGILLLL